MLILLVCNCGGAEPLARSVLKEAGVKDWLTTSLVRGHKNCLEWINKLPSTTRNLDVTDALFMMIKNKSKFAVVVGYDDDHFRWADVANGDLKSKLDGQVIAKQFE